MHDKFNRPKGSCGNMGLDITYIAGEEELCFGLPSTDIEVLEILAKKSFKKEVESVIGVSDFGEQCSIKKTELFKSIECILEKLRTDPKILPYTYSVKVEIPRGSGKYSTGSGMISGFRIKGEIYSIESGLDRCVLIKMRKDKSGKWEDCEPKDVRSLKLIKTDDDNFFGDIKISKRRKPTELIRNLEQLKDFISKSDSNVIHKILG